MAIGSGGNYALAAARALIDTDKDAETIVRRALDIAADICVYTNRNVTIETLRRLIDGGGYAFRPMTAADLPLIRRWLALPHVREWWGDPAEQYALVSGDLDEPAMDQFIVSGQGRRFRLSPVL